MEHTHIRPLKVYNASAGSGKTYHLVREYISLLISDAHHPSAFSQIIAMTFTNKAALEMKERIIKALDEMSSPAYFNYKADGLTKDLAQTLSISTEEVVNRSKLALKLILHQYEDFHVMTIDKFNLRLIKSFGRDLDLPADFEVVLDETELIEKIVDDLLNQLGEEGKEHLNQLMFRYAEANVDDGNSWNFRRELVSFAKILNNERNNALVDRLLETNFSMEHYGELHGKLRKMDQATRSLSNKIGEYLHQTGLSADELPGKSVTFNSILKLVNLDRFPLDEKLITATLIKNLDADLKSNQRFPEEVKMAIRALLNFRETELENYVSLRLFLSNFFNMALLQYMASALRTIKKEEQVIRISEFNTLISSLIQSENAPFIYERLGSRFQHFLLDEFQDTSRLQWLNLVPLVHDSMSQNKENLIVGDPKQSIYRFKNGVAEQFVELPRIYNPEKDPVIESHSDYFEQMGEVIPLENNWRSSATIVNFNNQFFDRLKSILPDSSVDFYNSVHQKAQSSVHGHIHIISKEEKKNAEELVPQLVSWIEECQAAGFQLGDICILGGTNYVCNTWALGLNELGYKVVSTDSLLIQSSLDVQLTIAYLKWRLKSSGENEKKRFLELFFRINAKEYDAYQRYLVEFVQYDGKTKHRVDDETFLADHFGGSDQFFFKHEGIYDLIQSFYRMMNYDELLNPYLHHLADIAFEYGTRRGPDLKGFLDDYAARKHKIAVQIPESDDAVKVMTIHKSKGLEFPVVILPSFDFSLDIKSTFLVDSGEYILYKKPSKSNSITVLDEIYAQETEQVLTDNVNICYVGMTRPVERLYVLNYFDSKKFGNYFHEVLSQLEGIQESEGTIELLQTDGERSKTKDASSGASLFIPVNIQDRLWFPHISLQDNELLNHEDFLSEQMQFGLQFHLLVSRIAFASAIEQEIDKAIQEGEVSEEHKKGLCSKIQDLLFRPDYQELFANHTKVLNEQTIIGVGGSIHRPDKIILKSDETIIIDYKTGLPNQKDEKQVKEYVALLRSMKYPNVSGYLFYSAIDALRIVS